ncbi:MAG: tetratricopeptide repeat protein [Motiliproteus sp.]
MSLFMVRNLKKNSLKLKYNDQQKLQQAIAMVQSKNMEPASVLCAKLLRKYPNNADVLHLLGVINFQQMKLDAAADLMLKAAQAAPGNPHFHCELARVEKKRGQPEEALQNYRLALKKPLSVPVYNEIGTFFYQYGEISLAADCFIHALALAPQEIMLVNNLAKCYLDLLQTDKAEELYRQTLDRYPSEPVSLNNLATIMRSRGEAEAGLALYSEQLRLAPEDSELKAACAKYLIDIGSNAEGETLFREVLAAVPLHQEATVGLCLLLVKDRLSEALSLIQSFVAKQPANASGHWVWARLLTHEGQMNEAAKHFEEALRIAPDNIIFHDDYAFASNYLEQDQQARVDQQHQNAASVLMRRVFCRPFTPMGELDSQRPLTIAYLSPDLHRHSVSYFLEPLLRGHDRRQVKVIVYSDSLTSDAVNQRLRGLADQWYDVAGISHHGLRRQIARDKVDVLVELAGHTGHNRLGLMASIAAPVQVSYLGYPNSLALPTIPYRITDEYADPQSEETADEQQSLLRLPGGFLCYQPDASAPQVEPPPSVSKGYITFGSFNAIEKLSVQTLQLWAGILNAVPDSRLLLKSRCFSDPEVRRSFVEHCGKLGIAVERLQVVGLIENLNSHLELYHEVDIALDPMPYNGATTTCETLWMGVPVVTMVGGRHASRVGSSLLHQVGLEELIARDEADYLRIATMLAEDIDRQQQLRATMRERMRASSLLDEPRICREIEAAYRNMWKAYCAEHQS